MSAARDLHALLAAFDPGAPLGARMDVLARLARWVFEDPGSPGGGTAPAESRLVLLCGALEDLPERRRDVGLVLRSAIEEADALHLFCEAGLPGDRGFLGGFADRVARKLLPAPPDDRDLSQILARAFPRGDGADRLAAAPADALIRLGAVLGDASVPARLAMTDAVRVLCVRTAALGMSGEIRRRSGVATTRESPFFELSRAGAEDVIRLTVACRAQIAVVLAHLEESGVSVDVVSRLEVMSQCLGRIEALGVLLAPARGDEDVRARAAARFVAGLAVACSGERSLRVLVRSDLRLLARKVIERAGVTGEHYITVTRREWWAMIASAAGGGAVTAVTCVLKFTVKWGHLPLFAEGLFSAVNYAASFIVIQLLGCTLATKQPSMTAAALAGSLRRCEQSKDLDEVVTMIARMCRSQFAAALGNILMVVPAAVAFDILYTASTGRPFLDPATAAATVASLDPLGSGTVPFAALTGVLLWASSVGAGWLENWAVYRRLPEAIAEHRARRWAGVRTTRFIGAAFARNVSGFGGNLMLGFLLAATPIAGKFFGVPLDVRHVTLSTGALALAVSALGAPLFRTGEFAWAVAGIAVIGVLNFGLSFALALGVALRARNVESAEKLRLARAVRRRFLESPREFFFPQS